MELSNEALESVCRYFNTLTHLGYKKYSDVYRLLIFLYFEELLESPMSMFVTEDDYRTITNAMYCLYGSSCLLPYPDYKKEYAEITHAMPDEYRISEDSILRIAEDKDIRVIL